MKDCQVMLEGSATTIGESESSTGNSHEPTSGTDEREVIMPEGFENTPDQYTQANDLEYRINDLLDVVKDCRAKQQEILDSQPIPEPCEACPLDLTRKNTSIVCRSCGQGVSFALTSNEVLIKHLQDNIALFDNMQAVLLGWLGKTA